MAVNHVQHRPLREQRVLVTRPRAQGDELARRLEAYGAQVIFYPAIQVVPVEAESLDQALRELASGAARVDWVVFTSANGVTFTCERLAVLGLALGVLRRARLAAVGPATARALTDLNLAVDFVPEKFVAEEIAAGIGDVRGQHILLLGAEITREALAERLQQLGARVTRVAVYRTVAVQPDEVALAELARGVDVVMLASASAARSFARAAAEHAWPWLARAVIACIGPVTAEAARDAGLAVQLVADEHIAIGLADALAVYFETTKR